MTIFQGVNLAMQTPFDGDGQVDLARAEELIEIYLDAGMHSIVLSSGTGQHPYLTEEDNASNVGSYRTTSQTTIQ